MDLEAVLLLVARLGSGAFAGSCLYIALVQQPARATLSDAAALDEFRAGIPRANLLQAPLNIGSLLASAALLLLRFEPAAAVAAVLLLVVLVGTVVAVLPINRRLLSGTAAEHLGQAPAALHRWGVLHGVRTVLALIAAVLLLLP